MKGKQDDIFGMLNVLQNARKEEQAENEVHASELENDVGFMPLLYFYF